MSQFLFVSLNKMILCSKQETTHKQKKTQNCLYLSNKVQTYFKVQVCLCVFQLLDINWTGLTNMLDIPGLK